MTVKVGETKYFKWAGEIKWSHLYEPDEFRGAKNYKVDFFPESKEVVASMVESGLQGSFKEERDENGQKTGREYYQFKRPAFKLIKNNMISFAPPVIWDANGNVLVEYKLDGKPATSAAGADVTFERVGDFINVGHGSKIVVDVAVYGTAYGPGNRLNGIKIIDLIEYIKPEDGAGKTTPELDGASASQGDGGAGKAVKAAGKAPW